MHSIVGFLIELKFSSSIKRLAQEVRAARYLVVDGDRSAFVPPMGDSQLTLRDPVDRLFQMRCSITIDLIIMKPMRSTGLLRCIG